MTGSPGSARASQVRNSSAGNVNGSAASRRAPGSNAVRPGHPPKVHESSASRLACRRTWVRGPTRPAHREMAGVSSTSWAVPTTDSAAQPNMANGWSTAATAPAMSSRAPAWGLVTVRTTRSGRSPMDSSTAPATSPVAWEATGCSDSALAKGTPAQSPVDVNRMSSERR